MAEALAQFMPAARVHATGGRHVSLGNGAKRRYRGAPENLRASKVVFVPGVSFYRLATCTMECV